MSSSETSAPAAPLAPAQLAFNWIELFPLPIASSIMLTQPIALLLTFLVQLTSAGTATPLDQLSITLFLLGMQWLALSVRYQIRRGTSAATASRIHVIGLFVALAILVVTHLFMLDNLLMLIISAALVVWFWKLGMDLTDPERSEELLTWFFRIGFFIIITLLVLTVLFQNPATIMVRDAMPAALPLFFISGLVGLSFSRLANIQRESGRHGASQGNAIRNWTLGLTIAWIVIVVAAFSLELYSFQAIQSLVVPVGAFLGNLITWIISAVFQVIGFIFNAIANFIAFLLHLLGISPHATTPPPHGLAPTPPASNAPTPKPGKVAPPSDLALTIGRILLAAIGLALLFVIVRVVQKRWRTVSPDDSEDEERESLSMREVLNERRQERQQQGHKLVGAALETLDPASARARYRELLQSMAEEGADRGRRPGETPIEYQKRLLVLAERAPVPSITLVEEGQSAAPTTPTILNALTRAYNRERYGTHTLDQQQRSFLQQWLPDLLQRLKRKPSLPTRPGARQ